MLALATPALHDHASSHAVAVSVPSNKTPLIRSKPLARRATASSSVLASSNSSYSSSSASSASSSSTVVPPSSSRSSLSSSQPHPSHETHSANRSEASSSRSSQQRLPVENLQSKQPNTAVALTETLASQPPATPAPVDINAYPTSDLLKVLASLLTQIATANDGLSSAMPNGAPESHTPPSGVRPPIWKTLFSASRISLSTPTSPLTFHARNIPSISLEAYLFRILRYCPTTNEVFLSLLVYFDRMSKLAQEASGKRFMIDSYNVHRLVIAGVTVASKFFSDVFYTNSRYAKVGGLPQAELNQLELQFLLLNDFRLSIPADEMQRYADQLIRYAQTRNGPDGGQPWVSPALDDQRAMPVSRPLQSMGAFDAFGGVIGCADGVTVSEAPRNSTPRRSISMVNGVHSTSGADVPDEQEERDQESSICSETDTDAETDDEPTIRAAGSCASSDTQSLFSNDASASEDGYSSFDIPGDDDDEDNDGPPTDDESSVSGLSRHSMHYRRSSSVFGSAHT